VCRGTGRADLRCLGIFFSGVRLQIRGRRERSGGGHCWIFPDYCRRDLEEIWRRSEDVLGFGRECGGERRFLGSWGLR
jgi:hypothetical protein